MPASLSGAESYFSPENHLQSAQWSRQDENKRKASIVHAKRILSRMVHVADIEAEIDVDVDDGINPEYAIYEQALWMLQNAPMINADETLPIPEASDPETESGARKSQQAIIAPEAIRWLTSGRMPVLSRG